MPIRYHNLRSESVLRGGNLRKVGKTILTRAPALALTPVLALGALLCLDTASRAGECIEQTGTPAHYVCSGIANGLFDTTRRLEAGSGEQLFVRQIVSSSPFGIDVTDGNALELYGSPDSTGINVDLMPVIVTEGENAGAGIFLEHKGTGDVHLSATDWFISTQGEGVRAFAGTASRNMDIRIGGRIGFSDVPVNGNGINALHQGTGELNIAAQHIVSRQNGISAVTGTTTPSVNIHATGSIRTDNDAISVRHQGLQSLSVRLTSLGRISTNGGHGIFAHSSNRRNDATGHTIIFVEGDIETGLSTRRGDAVHARHLSRGDLIVLHTSIAIGSNDGFELETSGISNDMIFASEGSVRAQDLGVRALHRGTGILSIRAKDITTQSSDAINAVAYSTSTDLSITATGNLTAGLYGIRAKHNGAGTLNITLADTATITSATRYGIYAVANNLRDDATGGVNISVGGDIGTEDAPVGHGAVHFTHRGKGDASVTLAQGVNLFAKNRGIGITMDETTSDVNLRTDGNIQSGGEGIRIFSIGTGNISVHAAGDIRNTDSNNHLNGEGIEIFSSMGGDVDLYFSGNIHSVAHAIEIDSVGTGHVSLHAAEGSTLHSQRNHAITVNAAEGSTTQNVDIHVAGHIGSRENYTAGRGIESILHGVGDVSATLAATGKIFAGETGIDITTMNTRRNATIRAYGDITSRQKSGIRVLHRGTGTLVITAGNIMSQEAGIIASTEEHPDSPARDTSLAEINIRANGNITSAESAIRAIQAGPAALNITTAPGTTLTSRTREVIDARIHQDNVDGMNITIGGNVVASGATPAGAVHGHAVGTGDINITVARGASIRGQRGITVTRDRIPESGQTPGSNNVPAGTAHIDVSGRVQGETAAISMDAAMTHRLTLRPGSQIIGNITSTGAENAILVLGDSVTGRRHGTFALDSISGFNQLNKNGTQNWNLIHNMEADQAFTLVTHSEGSMFINNSGLLTAPEDPDDISVLIEPNASLFVRGSNGYIEGNIRNNGELVLSQAGFVSGNLSNAGTLKVNGDNLITGNLTGAGTVSFERGNDNARLTVNGDFETGGTVVFNFSPTRGYTNTLDIQGELIGTEPTRVEVYTHGNVPPNFGGGVPFITAPTPQQSGDEVDETDSGPINEHADSFIIDRIISGAFTFDFEHDAALEGWVLRQSGFSPRVPAFKNYPASLAQLARLPSMQERLGGRSWLADGGRGVWAKAEGAHTYLEPSDATVKSSYEIRNRRVRFGLDVPLGRGAQHAPGRGWRLGANVSFGSADTDVAAVENNEHDGGIDTDLFTLALDARWTRPEGFYVDTQAQYAVFSSDIASQQESMTLNNDADAFRLSGELGYRFEAGGFFFAPQAQVEWGRVDFDGFIAPHNEIVSLEDGDVTDGRIGIVFDRQWTGGPDNRANLFAGAHLRIPFDGKTVVDVSSVPLVSERKDAALEINAGFDYRWDNNTLTAGLATVQGGEVEDYRASLSMRFDF